MNWFRKRLAPKAVTVDSILEAADKGRLEAYLIEFYTDPYAEHWKEILRKCEELTNEGYLSAKFMPDYDGSPLVLEKDARITMKGREYLEKVRARRIANRLPLAIFSFLSGVFSKTIVDLLALMTAVLRRYWLP